MFDYQLDYLILLHDAFLENHPGTQAITGPTLLFSDGFEVESITKNISAHFPDCQTFRRQYQITDVKNTREMSRSPSNLITPD